MGKRLVDTMTEYGMAYNSITPIIKVVDYCNFSCDFCRYPNNPHKAKMPFSTFQTVIEKACDFTISNGCFQQNVIFHGGEPLLWGFNNFEAAIDLQKELTKKHSKLVFRNSIQTNGSLLDDRWVEFLSNNSFRIGVSIDGPESVNFHKGPLDSRVVLENIQKLSQKNCKFGVLSVITDEHAGCAEKYYEFIIKHNIHSIGLCYCVYDEERGITVNNEILTNFLKRLFDCYYDGTYQLEIREFHNIIKRCLGIRTDSCTFGMRQRCGNFFSIRPNGDVFFCDPYSLSTPPLGNILTESFSDIKSKPEFIKIVLSAHESAIKECGDCDIKNTCGGGCFRNVFPSGNYAFCDTLKSLYPYIEKKVHSSINSKNGTI